MTERTRCARSPPKQLRVDRNRNGRAVFPALLSIHVFGTPASKRRKRKSGLARVEKASAAKVGLRWKNYFQWDCGLTSPDRIAIRARRITVLPSTHLWTLAA